MQEQGAFKRAREESQVTKTQVELSVDNITGVVVNKDVLFVFIRIVCGSDKHYVRKFPVSEIKLDSFVPFTLKGVLEHTPQAGTGKAMEAWSVFSPLQGDAVWTDETIVRKQECSPKKIYTLALPTAAAGIKRTDTLTVFVAQYVSHDETVGPDGKVKSRKVKVRPYGCTVDWECVEMWPRKYTDVSLFSKGCPVIGINWECTTHGIFEPSSLKCQGIYPVIDGNGCDAVVARLFKNVNDLRKEYTAAVKLLNLQPAQKTSWVEDEATVACVEDVNPTEETETAEATQP